MTKTERLIRRLNDELLADLPLDARCERTYAGHWQRTAGAWSWELVERNNSRPLFIGSQWPITELLAMPAIAISDDGGIRPADGV